MMIPDTEPLLEGGLEGSYVGDVLRSMGQEHESGLLVLTDGDATLRVHIWEGQVVFAATNDPDTRLGECLLIQGRITAPQYFDASLQIRPGRRLGAILVDMGALSADDLQDGVRAQVYAVLMNAFLWTKGRYALYLSDEAPSETIILSEPLVRVIYQGTMAIGKWSRILRGMGGTLDMGYGRTSHADTVISRLELPEEENHIFNLAAGGRMNAAAICDASYIPHFRTLQCLWALVACGALVKVPAGSRPVEEEKPAAEGSWQDVLARVNPMIQRVFELWTKEAGIAEANALSDKALAAARESMKQVFKGLDVRGTGLLDEELMTYNLLPIPEADRAAQLGAALNELLGALQLVHVERFGAGSMGALQKALQGNP